jgi:para-nitrobenzyl esterase
MSNPVRGVADTPFGRIAGEDIGGGITRFLGVPYAQAPAGGMRLRSPGPLAPWTGTREALVRAPASLQTLGGNQVWMNEPIPDQSEDCLYLNVWTPGIAGRAPVFFWLHGGQTRNGHGGAPGIDGAALARLGLVVVTISYRLGALGGLAHPELTDEATGLCANWGLQDKLAALEWVGRCISGFGGDPARVTLAGQSSGGANAVMIAQHGLAAGRYSGLIAQSPPLFRPPMFVDLDAAAEYTEALAARMGVTVPGLRAVDGKDIQRAEQAFASSPELAAGMGRPRTAPVRDGVLLKHWPYDAPPARVPVLTGWTREESNFWFDLRDGDGRVISPLKPPLDASDLGKRVSGLTRLHYAFPEAPSPQDLIAAYSGSGEPAAIWRDLYTDLVFRTPILRFAGGQARVGTPVWAYEFAYPLPAPGSGSPHASDVPFVFGTWGHPHLSCKIGTAPQVSTVSAAMMGAWAEFARSRNPGSGAGCAWPAFSPDRPQVMRFGPPSAAPVALERPAGLACWKAYAA